MKPAEQYHLVLPTNDSECVVQLRHTPPLANVPAEHAEQSVRCAPLDGDEELAYPEMHLQAPKSMNVLSPVQQQSVGALLPTAELECSGHLMQLP